MQKKNNYCSATHNKYRGLASQKIFQRESLYNFLCQFDNIINNGKIIKDGNSTTVIVSEYQSKRILIKKYNYKNLWHSILRVFIGSRAKKVFHNTIFLEKINIPTPAIYAYIDKRRFGITTESYIINEYIDAKNYGDLLRENALSENQKEAFLVKAENILKEFRKHRVYHGDIKHANFLIHNDDVIIIDLDALKRFRSEILFKSRHKKDMEKFHNRLCKWPL